MEAMDNGYDVEALFGDELLVEGKISKVSQNEVMFYDSEATESDGDYVFKHARTIIKIKDIRAITFVSLKKIANSSTATDCF
jgi:hypothetical protein